jgi:hypothetical protein
MNFSLLLTFDLQSVPISSADIQLVQSSSYLLNLVFRSRAVLSNSIELEAHQSTNQIGRKNHLTQQIALNFLPVTPIGFKSWRKDTREAN